MKRTYQRSQILNYAELTQEQQLRANDLYDNCHNYKFVLWGNEPVSLSDFTVTTGKMWDGAAMLSAFSGYYLKVNEDNSEATVVYAHW